MTSETTTWEHAWGIELSASYSSSLNLILESNTISMGVTLSYNGKDGTSSTVEDKQTVEKRQSYECPARHHCFLNLLANHLDGQKVPFTATVRKIVGSTITEYEEKGTLKNSRHFPERGLIPLYVFCSLCLRVRNFINHLTLI